jgi:hypothetical protein
MAFHEVPTLHALLDTGRPVLESLPHADERVVDLRAVEVETRVGEYGFIDSVLARELLHIGFR